MYNPPSQTRVGMKHASFFFPSCSCSALCIYVAVSLSFFSVDVSSFFCACILWCRHSRSVLACLHRRLPFKGISMLSLSFFSVWARSVVRRAFGVCAQSVVCFVLPSSANTGYQSMALVIWYLRTPSGQVRYFFLAMYLDVLAAEPPDALVLSLVDVLFRAGAFGSIFLVIFEARRAFCVCGFVFPSVGERFRREPSFLPRLFHIYLVRYFLWGQARGLRPPKKTRLPTCFCS